MSGCDIAGCANVHVARGWCGKHYQKYKKRGDPLAEAWRPPTPGERFAARAEWQGECLVWTGSPDSSGYGSLRVGGRSKFAHRYAWEQAHGPIPDGLTVDHLCFNTLCVNVGHLRLLTRSENSRNQRSAYITRCRRGHPYDSENTYRTPAGNRFCRACNRAAVARYKKRKEAAL